MFGVRNVASTKAASSTSRCGPGPCDVGFRALELFRALRFQLMGYIVGVWWAWVLGVEPAREGFGVSFFRPCSAKRSPRWFSSFLGGA